MASTNTAWSDAPIVFITIAVCPGCGSTQHKLFRTEQNGDGTVTRKAVCTDCGARFKIIPELPEIGNSPFRDC